MTTISTLIRDAYRESNLIRITADPTVPEQAEGLRLLNRFVASLYGQEAGDPLTSYPVGGNNIDRPDGFPGDYFGDSFVPANSRLILNLTEAKTLYLHPRPQDGARLSIVDKSSNLATYNLTLDGNGYTVGESTTSVLATNGLARDYFFRQDIGDWAVVSPLIASNESPFPSEFDDLLIVGLAIRLDPRNGAATNPLSLEAFRSNRNKFRARYRQIIEVDSEEGLIRTPGRRRRFGSSDFDRGVE